ncbi:MAG: hypothetical protein WC854_07700 [Bacteroidales bacterium]
MIYPFPEKNDSQPEDINSKGDRFNITDNIRISFIPEDTGYKIKNERTVYTMPIPIP